MKNVIDSILDDVHARPDAWIDAWNAAPDMCSPAAWSDAWGALGDVVWGTARIATLHIPWNAARIAARAAVCALTAWPESAALLDRTPDALRTIISTHDGDVKHQAVLLLPAVIARQVPPCNLT